MPPGQNQKSNIKTCFKRLRSSNLAFFLKCLASNKTPGKIRSQLSVHFHSLDSLDMGEEFGYLQFSMDPGHWCHGFF